MEKHFVFWESDQTKLTLDPKERGARWNMLITKEVSMVRSVCLFLVVILCCLALLGGCITPATGIKTSIEGSKLTVNTDYPATAISDIEARMNEVNSELGELEKNRETWLQTKKYFETTPSTLIPAGYKEEYDDACAGLQKIVDLNRELWGLKDMRQKLELKLGSKSGNGGGGNGGGH